MLRIAVASQFCRADIVCQHNDEVRRPLGSEHGKATNNADKTNDDQQLVYHGGTSKPNS
jgi:hypothetical protein